MTEGINTKHNIEITVLSPLHIGAGVEKELVKGVDFVEKDHQIHILNLKKMVQNGMNPDELSVYFAKKDHEGLLKKIQGKLDKVTDAVFNLPISSTNDIKSFLKNQLTRRPVIAGSSLKGAVRSVILDYLLQGKRPGQLNERDYFGDSKKGDDLMRFIKFSDAEFDKTELVNTKIFNLQKPKGEKDWQGGWKQSGRETNPNFEATGFNTIYECIMPNEKGVASIMLSESAFRQIASQLFFQDKSRLFNIHELFNVINQHTYDYIGKELDFFAEYNQADYTNKIRNSLTAISDQIPDEDDDVDSCVLKMAAGSGFHSITGDWQYDDYAATGTHVTGKNTGKQKYKSRKIVIYKDRFSLMGFVKISLIK